MIYIESIPNFFVLEKGYNKNKNKNENLILYLEFIKSDK